MDGPIVGFLFALGIDWDFVAAAAAILIGVPLIVLFGVWLLRGGLTGFGEPALHRCVDGICLHSIPEPGDVCVRYHTYRGLFLWTVVQEHIVIAPADDAHLLLQRLLRYNLTWGLLCRGGVFVPLVALGNYVTRKRRITRQIREAKDDRAEGSE